MLSMSYNEKECFFILMVKAAESVEMTGSQMTIIEYFNKVGHEICDGIFNFDINDIPWNHGTTAEDKQFILKMIDAAKKPETMEKLYSFMRQDPEIINPFFDRFTQMLESFALNDAGGEPGNGPKVFFKMGMGWKACRDESRNIYTAEHGSRGYYQLCEIDKETYDRLGSDIEGDETAEDLIRKGRCLFETDDDGNSRSHCIVHDDDYNELAPWSSAQRKYEIIYGN